MQSPTAIDFHESSILGVHREGNSITLQFEGVHLGDEIYPAIVRLIGVKHLTRDGIEVADFAPECDDGEILTLQHTQTTMHLIVEWPDFKKHLSETHSYRMIFDSIEVEIPS